MPSYEQFSTQTCVICGATFQGTQRARYCSQACNALAYRRRKAQVPSPTPTAFGDVLLAKVGPVAAATVQPGLPSLAPEVAEEDAIRAAERLRIAAWLRLRGREQAEGAAQAILDSLADELVAWTVQQPVRAQPDARLRGDRPSRLTPEARTEIRRRYATTRIAMAQLAREYGVSRQAIYRLLKGPTARPERPGLKRPQAT